MSSADNLAVTALVISIVALLVALGQLLQQYFATADGYRRCQASVMGRWSERTRLRWRWRQFRFETLYTTPEIFISGFNMSHEGEILVLGDTVTRKLTLAPPATIWEQTLERSTTTERKGLPEGDINDRLQNRKGSLHQSRRAAVFSPDPVHRHSDELVSWLPLLHWLHEATRASFESVDIPNPSLPGERTPTSLLTWRRYPALVMQERSWDFQPPDVIRPLAKTTVSAIAILARRMGMRWKDFRPEDGVMRAEGHSHIITSTVVRGLGLVLQYNYTGRSKRLARQSQWRAAVAGSVYKEQEEIYVATPGADRFGAGVIRGSRAFAVPDFTIGTQQEIVTSLRTLDPTQICSTILKKVLKKDPEFTFPVADLVALTSHVLCQTGSPLVQIPAPSDNVNGLTAGPLGRTIFTQTLDVYVRSKDGAALEGQEVDWTKAAVGRQTCWVLWQLKDLQARYPEQLQSEDEYEDAWIVRRPLEYLEALKKINREVTNLLRKQLQDSGVTYTGLLQSHLIAMVFGRGLETSADDVSEDEIAKVLLGTEGQIIGHYYSDLPKFIKVLKHGRSDKLDETLVVDLWMMMMFKAFCWGASHFFVPGERVPIAYFGSQLPVYIG